MGRDQRDMKLFWACFIALIATSFGFIVRIFVMDEWATQFGLSKTQRGEIFGVGLWPFAISIVLFSLIIDKIGYKVAMAFAFVCHVAYMAIVIAAPTLVEQGYSGYWVLWVGSFVGALGNGTVEAVINPVVATMFNKDKSKWLNILHAGWPGGLVLGGLLALGMEGSPWQMKVGLVGLPVLAYGVLMLVCQFPVNERVTAGVSFRDMLKEVGTLGAFLVSLLIVFELSGVVGKLFGIQVGTEDVIGTVPVLGDVTNALAVKFGIAGAIAVLFGLYTMSLGRFMFVFLMLIMMPLAITELGTDSWISDLTEPEMKLLGGKGTYVLIYTSFIMMVLRFCAGPIIHKLSPLGLLALSSAIAAAGLVSLSLSAGAIILAAATLYAFGKTFFWPTMLGVVAEQFPKGGALTLNAISGLGMMAVGILGTPLLGNIQDKEIDRELAAQHPAIHATVTGETKPSLFGPYKPVEPAKLETASADDKKVVTETQDAAKKNALKTVALFPAGMLVCYVLLLLYFKTKGGYAPVTLDGKPAPSH
ncbi:MAG: MFS transporter [Fimbriiglobus sp.]